MLPITFCLAEAINLALSFIGGAVTTPVVDWFKSRGKKQRILTALTSAIQDDQDLSPEIKNELTNLLKDKQFIAAFLDVAAELDSGSIDMQFSASKATGRIEFEQRWKIATSNLDEAVQAKIWEKLRTVSVETVVKTLPFEDQRIHYMLDYLQMRLDQLQKIGQQGKKYLATIAELKREQYRYFEDLRVWLEPYREEIIAQGLGNVSVDHRVDAYLPKILPILTRDGCKGRETEIQEINAFVQDRSANCDQWWWWQADAWAGKTTLMAHLAAHPEPEVSVAAVFLIGRQPANSDSDAFYNYLIPQLAQIAGLTRIEIPSDIQGCIAQFKRLIDVAAAQTRLEGKRLVILVDGLDEDQSPYYTTKKQSVAASLPESLPPNVRVIISSRFNLLLPTDVPDIHPLRNSKFTHLLVQSELAKANRVAATKELEDILSYKDAQGIRYGRDMLAFMAASGGWLTAHDLKDLTHQDLYSINEILNKGATARTFGVMQSADGEQSYSLGHDLLDQLLVCNYLGKKIRYPLEQGTDTERVSDRARYQQQRFHTLKDWRHRIALWAEEYTKLKWPLSTTPDYLCSEFLAELLSNDPDLEESAIATLTDSSRIRLLRRKHGSNYQSISQLQTCIDIFAERVKTIQSRTLINLTTALHFLSKLSQRTHNIPSGLPAVFTLIGRHTYAVELALSVTNPLTRADALCRIATILAESGKINEAKRIAEYALSSANAITEANPRVKALVLADIATVLTKAGNTAKAFNIAKTIDDSYDKALIIAAMAITLEKSGKTDDAADFVKRALCIANTSSNSYEIVQILTDISTAFEKSGDTEEVFDIAEHALSNENISTNSFKKHLVSAVTDIALAKSSNTKKTTNINDFKLDTVDTIIHPYEKAQVLTDIATELATSGNIEEATDIAERALRAADTSTYQYEKEEKERILVDVATALAKSNNFEDAIKIANSITTPYEKDQVLADISIAIAKNGNSDRATRIAHTITEPSTKDQAHAGIAIALAESGNVEKATIISQTLTFPYAKDRYLSKTAIMLMKSSNIAKATNTANAITNPYTKDQVLADLVIILTNSCNINEATDTANTITDLYEKDRAFAAIAITHVKSGRTEEAKDIANTITDTYELVRVLAEIAVAVMKSGNTIDATKTIEHALSTADTYVVPFENGRALAAIVAILARSGHAEEANSIANTITDPYAKCQALVDVATGFAKSDNTEKAIEIAGDALIIADTITYPYSRPLVLGELAIGFSMPQLEAYRVKATVAMLLAAENPWSQFDVLLHVASAPALAILPLLLYEEEN